MKILPGRVDPYRGVHRTVRLRPYSNVTAYMQQCSVTVAAHGHGIRLHEAALKLPQTIREIDVRRVV